MTQIKSRFPELQEFFKDNLWDLKWPKGEWAPAINIVDNEEDYEVEVAAPGFKKEDFDVTVDKGILTIAGSSEREEEEKEKNYTRKEFTSRSFTRSFTLPEHVSEEDVKAKYEDGVLRLRMVKNKEALPPRKQVLVE